MVTAFLFEVFFYYSLLKWMVWKHSGSIPCKARPSGETSDVEHCIAW